MLSDQQIETIDEISVLGPVTSRELIRSMAITGPALRSRLRRLRQDGYVTCRKDQINGFVWSLTDKGRDWVTAPEGLPLAETIS